MIPAIWFPENAQNELRAREIMIPEPVILQKLTDEQAMKLAIQEAYRGLGFVSPNPLVGCVILDFQNRFLAKGFHARYGQGHAEVQALRNLDESQLKGARVFVTLEPCAHEGKPPSCAKMLAQLPVHEVVYGLVDPFPLVAGKGAEILKAAGIKVRLYEGLTKELEQICEHFLWNVRQKKVFVSAKIASSLDGQLAMATGESKWITDEVSRSVGHVLRAAHDGIMVGSGTLLMDDPSLNVRTAPFDAKELKVIIVGSAAQALPKAAELKIAKAHRPENVYFAISENLPKKPENPWGARILNVPFLPATNSEPTKNQAHLNGNRLDLKVLFSQLHDQGLRSVFVEGGARVLSSLLNQELVQRLYLFQAPMILGAKSGKSWTEQVSILSMGHKLSLKDMTALTLRNDLFITGRLN